MGGSRSSKDSDNSMNARKQKLKQYEEELETVRVIDTDNLINYLKPKKGKT